jgi:hypothetical protein
MPNDFLSTLVLFHRAKFGKFKWIILYFMILRNNCFFFSSSHFFFSYNTGNRQNTMTYYMMKKKWYFQNIFQVPRWTSDTTICSYRRTTPCSMMHNNSVLNFWKNLQQWKTSWEIFKLSVMKRWQPACVDSSPTDNIILQMTICSLVQTIVTKWRLISWMWDPYIFHRHESGTFFKWRNSRKLSVSTFF